MINSTYSTAYDPVGAELANGLKTQPLFWYMWKYILSLFLYNYLKINISLQMKSIQYFVMQLIWELWLLVLPWRIKQMQIY
jgi:hypothetical protein